MRLILLSLLCGIAVLSGSGQDAKEMRESGNRYLQQGDFANAIIVLKKAAETFPDDAEIINDLGLSYFLAGQYKDGYQLMRPMAESKLADDRSFQICAMLLRGARNIKEAELVYRMGLQKFPNSGALHADYGEYLQLTSPGQQGGIFFWEKGIQFDPAYAGNYYLASRHYAENGNWLPAVLYAETFINLESFTSRTVEMKNLLYEGFKKLFALELNKAKTGGEFDKQVVLHLRNQEFLAGGGITPEVLTAIRTRFILDWFKQSAANQPFSLFEYQRQMLKAGIFDAYNQWLFGSVANISAFQNWTKTHPEEYVRFHEFRRNQVFTVPQGQYYRQAP